MVALDRTRLTGQLDFILITTRVFPLLNVVFRHAILGCGVYIQPFLRSSPLLLLLLLDFPPYWLHFTQFSPITHLHNDEILPLIAIAYFPLFVCGYGLIISLNF